MCQQEGYTALLVAALTGEHEVARVLVEAGANINATSNVRLYYL